MSLLLSKNDMQQKGSATTYGRRFTLQSLISLPAEDDDGESCVSRTKTTFSAPKKPVNKVEAKVEPKIETETKPKSEGVSFRKRTKSSHSI
jgi:hypothetical protein